MGWDFNVLILNSCCNGYLNYVVNSFIKHESCGIPQLSAK